MPSSIISITRIGALAASLCGMLAITNYANAADNVIVLDSGEAQLTLIDPATRKVVGTEPTGKEPHHLMITPDGRSLIVADSVSNNLMFLDPQTGKVQRTVEDICVFRTNVTGLFGIVTGDFGNVTWHFGNVTERTGRQDWRCA